MALGKAGDGVHRLLSQRRDDEARRQRVAGHTETPVVLGGGARQRDDAALRNAVDAAIVEGAE
jgi:DhnA family fructose-bisphosphate aldolase class Ia